MGQQGKRKSAESGSHEAAESELNGLCSDTVREVKRQEKKGTPSNMKGFIKVVKYLIMTFKGALSKISSFSKVR